LKDAVPVQSEPLLDWEAHPNVRNAQQEPSLPPRDPRNAKCAQQARTQTRRALRHSASHVRSAVSRRLTALPLAVPVVLAASPPPLALRRAKSVLLEVFPSRAISSARRVLLVHSLSGQGHLPVRHVSQGCFLLLASRTADCVHMVDMHQQVGNPLVQRARRDLQVASAKVARVVLCVLPEPTRQVMARNRATAALWDSSRQPLAPLHVSHVHL
jgi:hypothetical protein